MSDNDDAKAMNQVTNSESSVSSIDDNVSKVQNEPCTRIDAVVGAQRAYQGVKAAFGGKLRSPREEQQLSSAVNRRGEPQRRNSKDQGEEVPLSFSAHATNEDVQAMRQSEERNLLHKSPYMVDTREQQDRRRLISSFPDKLPRSYHETVHSGLSMQDIIKQNRTLASLTQQLQEELDQMRQEYAEQDLFLRQAQESAYRLLDQPTWAPDAGSTKQRLKQLERRLKAFSRQYATQQAVGGLIDDERTSLRRDIQAVLRYGGDGLAGGLRGEHMKSKAPGMLLLSCFTYYLYEAMLRNPFLFLDVRVKGTESDTPLRYPISTPMYYLWIEVASYDETEAQTWRSHTLRMLDPRGHNQESSKTGRINVTRERTRQAIDETCSQHASQFLNSSFSALIRDPHAEDMKKELLGIFREAGDLSHYLWTQKLKFTYLGAKDLPLIFDRRNEMLEVHPSQLDVIDADESALDGQPIQLVLHPAVLVYGNSDGSRYDTYSVWKKAVVWIGQPATRK